MASYNTGTTASATNPKATPFTFTVPAGVATGDVMIAIVGAFVWTPSVTSYTTPTSGGGSWTQIGTLKDTGASSGLNEQLQVFYRVATASDPGSTFSISFTGTQGTDQQFWHATLDAYTGFNTGGPIGNFTFTAQSVAGGITNLGACPSTITTQPGSWGIQFTASTISSSGSLTASPATNRHQFSVGNGCVVGVSDTNGSAGATGASIGGGTFTASGQGWCTVGVLELITAAPASPPAAAPPRIPHPRLVPQLLEVAQSRADWQAQGVADLTVAFSSSSGGVDTWNVTSPYNSSVAGAHPMRVLKPTTVNANYPHAFLLMLPVDPDQGTTFGDSIGTAQSISAHNTYNLTCIQPGYAAVDGSNGPWFSDNPLNQGIYQETFTLKLLDWIKKNLATTGQERVYLIGFSRSGIGGQGLLFRHPYLFAATASWDAPFMMTDYDGTDPTAGFTISGDPAGSYGTSANFKTNYQLSAAHLGFWQATGQYAANRIWLGQGPAFPDTAVYDAALTTAGIPHTYTFSNTVEAHGWQTDWVAAALASMIPGLYTEAPSPPRIPHPLWLQPLVEVAARRTLPALGAASASNSVAGATAALTFAAPAGSVSASSTVTGTPAALTLAAPAGSASADGTVPGATAALTLTASPGTAATGSSVTGTAATLTLAAPAGSVAAGAIAAGVTAAMTLAAPAGSVSASSSVTGTAAALTLGAAAGTAATGTVVTGLQAMLALAAPAGSVSASSSVTGVTAALALGASPGSAGSGLFNATGTSSATDPRDGTPAVTAPATSTAAVSDG